MSNSEIKLNHEVTKLLDNLNHPLRKEIDQLRIHILSEHSELTENVKWNGPNYCINNNDRVTMRVHPPKQIQLIFHRGVKKLQQPKDKLIQDNSGLLSWKENDRAIATLKNMEEIENRKLELNAIIKDWISATS